LAKGDIDGTYRVLVRRIAGKEPASEMIVEWLSRPKTADDKPRVVARQAIIATDEPSPIYAPIISENNEGVTLTWTAIIRDSYGPGKRFCEAKLLADGTYKVTQDCNWPGSACYPPKSERQIIGPEPLTAELRSSAQRAGVPFFDEGEFNVEKFTYIGEVVRPSGKRWNVAFLGTEWGQACRYTSRFLVFTPEKEYLGQYYGTNTPVRVDGDTVYFESEPGEGSKLQFTDEGPPKGAWLGGDNPEFHR
jgi:hypothetical protein